MLDMTEREKYLFDIQGFLVVRDFLSPEEVARLNEAVDAHADRRIAHHAGPGGSRTLRGRVKSQTMLGMLTWEKPWCDRFRAMLAHPKTLPYLNATFGRGWRLDHEPFFIFSQRGAEGHKLHNAFFQFDQAQYYIHKNGLMRCGMVVFQYQLADAGGKKGGFACIPGSHKANYACPDALLDVDADQEAVACPEVRAGDLLIFNEATTHGALPWKAVQERRALLYRFSPKNLHFAGGYHQSAFPDWVEELTEAQRAVLEPPYIYNRPLIEDDGQSVVRPRKEDVVSEHQSVRPATTATRPSGL